MFTSSQKKDVGDSFQVTLSPETPRQLKIECPDTMSSISREIATLNKRKKDIDCQLRICSVSRFGVRV